MEGDENRDGNVRRATIGGRIPKKKKKLARSGSGGSGRSHNSSGTNSTMKSQLRAMKQYRRVGRKGGDSFPGPKSPSALDFTDDDDGGGRRASPGISVGSKNKRAKKSSEPMNKKRRRRIVTSDSDDSDYEEGVVNKKKRGRTGEARAPRRKQYYVSVPLGVEIGNKKGLKPSLKVGDAVYAAWWPDANRRRANTCSSWYKGTITSTREKDEGGTYGPRRYYSITYEDDDELDDVEELFVFSRLDYELSVKRKKKAWIGVRTVLDPKATDPWARDVGWCVAEIDGEERAFSLLSDALRAYDDSVVRRMRAKTKPSSLNLPDEWEFGEEFRGETLSSDFIGVTIQKNGSKPYASRFYYTHNGRYEHHVGTYKLAADAALARDEAMRRLEASPEKLNFATDQEYLDARAAELRRTGMIVDFGEVRAYISSKVDEKIATIRVPPNQTRGDERSIEKKGKVRSPRSQRSIVSSPNGSPMAHGIESSPQTVSKKTDSMKKKSSGATEGKQSGKETMVPALPEVCPEIATLNDAMAKKWAAYLPSETGQEFRDLYDKGINEIFQDLRSHSNENPENPIPSTVSVGNGLSDTSVRTKDSNKVRTVSAGHRRKQACNETPGANALDTGNVAATQNIRKTAPPGLNRIGILAETTNMPTKEPSTKKSVTSANPRQTSGGQAHLPSIEVITGHSKESKRPKSTKRVSVGNKLSDKAHHSAKTDCRQNKSRGERPGNSLNAAKVLAAQTNTETLSQRSSGPRISVKKPHNEFTEYSSAQKSGKSKPHNKAPRPSTNSNATHLKKKADPLELTASQIEELNVRYPIGCLVWFRDKVKDSNGGDDPGQSFHIGVVDAVFLDLSCRDIIYKVGLTTRQDNKRSEMMAPEHGLCYAPKCPVSVSPSFSDSAPHLLQGETLMCRAKSRCQITLSVRELQERLSNVSGDCEKLKDILKQLANVPMNVPILKETRIGRSVAALRKHNNSFVAKQASELVIEWKEIANKEEAVESGDSPVAYFYTVLIFKKGNGFYVENNVSSERVKYRKPAKVGVEENESSNSTLTTATGLC